MGDLQKYVLEQPLGVQAFFQLVDTTAQLIGISEKYWHSQGINGARIRILVEIAKAGGAILPSVLAARIGVTKANISVLLVPLEQNRLIRSMNHPEDGRKRTIQLTDEGGEMLMQLLPGNRTVIAGQMAKLTVEEQSLLVTLLTKLQREGE